ncbi:myeloid cell surface antigen CD33-like [Symphorus nematophorus]
MCQRPLFLSCSDPSSRGVPISVLQQSAELEQQQSLVPLLLLPCTPAASLQSFSANAGLMLGFGYQVTNLHCRQRPEWFGQHRQPPEWSNLQVSRAALSLGPASWSTYRSALYFCFDPKLSTCGVLAACPLHSGLFITARMKMEALSGSCLQIPCNFRLKSEQEFDSSRETFGVWIKNSRHFAQNPNNVIFNSSKTDNIYPISILGNLREKNCTTLFSSLISRYTDTYYFRIENRPFLATAICDPLQITVKDSPPRPRIEISGDLQEKESVTITCSAFTPCPHSPPKLTWNLQQDSHNKTEENTDGTFTTKIQETITLSEQHDGYNITCSARYPVNGGQDVKTAEETKTLSVSSSENIHYEEIDFSRQKPEPSSESAQDSGQQQDTLYAQVKVSSRQTADEPEDLYTQVKKK